MSEPWTALVRILGVGAAALVLVGAWASAGAQGQAQDVKYGIGSWPERGHGNHRAVLHVAAKAPAVWAHIEWRRRDRDPEKKAVLVFDAATAKQVTNVAAVAITREYGDLVFQPATAPGDYYVYYLPYNPGTGNFDNPGAYFTPKNTADPGWVAAEGLTPQGLAAGKWRSLPRATLVEIQARNQFSSMYPMEVIATADETAKLLAAHPDASYLLFPEDRKYPIRMYDDLPLRWIRRGPSDEFSGEARPGEYYVFQIGVWAARRTIPNLALTYSGLAGEGGRKIAAKAFTCFNLGGTDCYGRPMTKTFEVGRGKVRPLWVGFMVPEDAAGTYTGTVRVAPEGASPTTVRLRLKVAGPVLKDHGDSDLWRMSRLRWLNSTLGIDDDVVPPFTPLVVKGDAVSCLLRTVRFGPTGLPASIVATKREILAAPVALRVDTPEGLVRWGHERTVTSKIRPAAVWRETKAEGGGLSLGVASEMEADGCIMFTATLKAERDVDLRDLRLEVPMRRDVAKYMMGLGKRGGWRPAAWHWKWDINRADNELWLGDFNAGLQLQLRGHKDVWQLTNLRATGLPESWDNGGKGGCDVTQEGDRVVVRAYTGERRLSAGQTLELRFRFLVTPFKPIDPDHWNWRYGGLGGGATSGANILHIHHGTYENPYINYPFITADRLAARVRAVKAMHTARSDFGKLTYPAEGNFNPAQGAIHLWVRVNFDPHAGEARQSAYNQELFDVDYPNGDQVGFYWNIDDRGMRAYVRSGPPEQNKYPALMGTGSPDWREGQRHLLTLSWGERLAIFVDGKLKGSTPYRGTLKTPLSGAKLLFDGAGFGLEAVKITDQPYQAGVAVEPVADAHTLLLDTFSHLDGTRATHPERIADGGEGTFTGTIETTADDGGGGTGAASFGSVPGREVRFSYREAKTSPKGVSIYYTVRELSDHVVEMWPLRSLGDEVFVTGGQDIYAPVGPAQAEADAKTDGGYPWLKEHLVSGYVPAWRQPLPDGETDAAIATQGLSRWHNYYVEGLRWLMQKTGVDGLYLDGIGYDREIMKRVRKVMYRTNPHSRINFHCGNDYDYQDRRCSPANEYMEHFPYITSLWFGEMFDYDRSPDYWLVEISGIPFGLTSEMLNYQNGGNAYRGMIYGMSGRLHPSAPYMWRFWDEFGIQKAEMLGYWSPKCPVHTDQPSVLATVYRKPGKSLIALASWPEEGTKAGSDGETGKVEPGAKTVRVRLKIDWKALGLDPAKATLTAPGIEHFQEEAHFSPTDAIPVEPGKGWLLVVSDGK